MNRSFRQVWSAARGAYIIAPETARGNGKAGRAVRAARASGLFAIAATLAGGALAQGKPATTVVPTGGTASAYVSANGVPVVNINTPNAAGLSHNQYTRYDVDAKGLVLNNSSFANAPVLQSQLAGQVVGNMNLGAQARVILNEVVSNSRSTLAGYTEVVGGKADVIVANQYGITCSGCGFINSDRVTLTTGVPFLNADGGLGGFNVSRGDVLVNGSGLNASAQQILDIVTRSVRLDGQLNTGASGELGIHAGLNRWSYGERALTGAVQAADAAPAYAIDSTVLGGMYAGRIRLIATEAGVGVRMLGDAAAGAGDFRLDTAGKVLLQGRVSASADLALRQAGTGGAAQVELSGANASLTAQANLSVHADGGLALDEGLLKAGAGLTVRAQALDDRSTANASRSAGGNVDVAVGADATLDGASWGAGGRLGVDAGGKLALRGATLHSGSNAAAADRTLNLAAGGDADVERTRLTSADALAVAAGAGKLRFDAASEASAAGGIALGAATGFDNAGKLLSGAGLAVKGAAGMKASNSGLIQSQGLLAIGQADAGLALANAADGKLLGTTVAISATTLDNAGAVQGSDGMAIAATGALVNRADALVLSTGAGKELALRAASLDNAGRMQSAGKLGVAASGGAANSGQLVTTTAADGGADGALVLAANGFDNSGMLVAAGAAEIGSAAHLGNSGRMQGATMSLTAAKAIVNKGPDGVMLARDTLALRAATLDNGGAIQAGSELSAETTGLLDNSGTLQARTAGGQLSLQGGATTNSGTVQAAGKATLRATSGDLLNKGQVAAAELAITADKAVDNRGVAVATGAASVSAATLDNSGTLQGGSLLDVAAAGAFVNSGMLQAADAGGTLALRGAHVVTSGTVQSADRASLASTSGDIANSGTIVAGGALGVQAARALGFDAGSKTLAGKTLDLRAASLVNRGTLQAGDVVDANISGRFENASVIRASGGGSMVDVRASSLSNTGAVQSGGNASLAARAGGLTNFGELSAGGSLSLYSTAALLNGATGVAIGAKNLGANGLTIDNQGTLQATDTMQVNAGDTLTNSGLLLTRAATGTLSASGKTVTTSGTIQAAGAATLAATRDSLSNSGKLTAGGDLDITVASALDNSGAAAQVIGSGDMRIGGNAGFALANAGRIQASGDLAIGAAGRAAGTLQNTGTLFGTDLSLHGGAIVNGGRVQALGNGSVSASSLTNQGSTAALVFGIDHGDAVLTVTGNLRNEGALHSGGDLTVRAAGVDNTGTAGISSLADATLTATNGGIVNAGALYAAGTLATRGTGQTIHNTSSGTMDATDITVAAATFSNYNSVIATNDTDITTTVAFNNKPTGGVPNVIVARTDYDAATTPHDSGEYNCNIFGAACDHLWVFAQNYRVTQGLDGAMPTQKGEIIAGNSITIRYGQSGSNTASLISAPNIDISGAGAFVNEDLHLEEISYARRWRDYKTNSTFGSLNHAYSFPTTDAQFGCNDGGCFTGSAGSAGAAADGSFGLETGRRVIQVWRAGIYATNLNFNGGSLMNLGSPYTQAAAATTGSAVGAASATPVAGAGLTRLGDTALVLKGGAKVNPAAETRTVSVPAANGISFTGLNLALPSNPNGYFVQAKDPTANYLVEANPLFQVGSNSIGSDYLSKLIGIDPDKQQKRLGDANYEAKLVRDQLIAQTGNNIIKGMQNEAAQLQALMDNAGRQSASLGLVFGQPLTREQAAELEEDMVWMVEQVVAGQKVLAPVVYLAAGTRAAIESGGPVISATNASIKAGTLANTGGTIAGDTLAIETEGDLRNTGGKIKGGDVSVKSTGGSIINETVARTQGGKDFARTVIGATGSIESTGTLALDAAKDISVKGASVKAGGDASLAAGGKLTFDTIEDKRADATHKASEGLWGLSGSSESTRTATTTNIGSALETGGNLKLKSGGDTTIAGSAVKAGGDLDLEAGGNVNVVARQDTVETSKSSSNKGLGVGGGLYGETTTTTDAFKGRNVAAGIEVGGNAKVNTEGTLTVQGSSLKVSGDAAIAAGDVQVLAGQDVDRSTTTTTTTSFLKISGEGKADSGARAGSYADSSASAGSKKGAARADAQAGAGASASAEASASANAGLTLAETTTTSTLDYKSRAVGSQLEIGGGLKLDSKKDIVLQGATVNTGGDTELNAARDVKILASQDVDISTSKTTTTSIGLFVESENKASAGAEASAGAAAGARSDRYGSAADASAQAGARAGAEASSDTNIDLVRTSTTETNSLDVRNNGSTINAGGKLKIGAGEALTVQGSDIGGEQGVALKAKDMSFLAAEDVSVTTTGTTKTSAGLYISGAASAEAGASASASAGASQDAGGQRMGAAASAEAGASAEAKLGAGIQARHSTESSVEGTTTARVSSIRSGSGDVERHATGGITDVGTAIEAAGDFSQSAATIESRAAKNTSFSSSESQSDSMKLGVYAKAGAEAKASASASADAGAGLLGPGAGSGSKSESEAGADVSAGVEAQYTHASSSSSSNSSEAVVSTIKAGGKVKSASTGKTTFEGTQIAGDGGVELEAKEIDFKAARNTESSSESSLNVNAAANVGLNLGSSGAVDGGLSGGFEQGTASASSSTAVTGSIQSGAGLSIKTAGDARFEGTDIGAAGDASIAAGGKLGFDAARNESTESSNAANAQVSLSVSKSRGAGGSESGAGLEAEGGFSNDGARSSEAVTGKIAAGGNLTLSSGKDMKFEGTSVQAGGDTDIEAGGNVDFAAARNTSSSESTSLSASLSLSASSSSDSATGDGEKSRSGAFGAEGGYSREKSSEAVSGTLETGGNLKIKSGGNASFEGTDIAAGGSAAVDAKGDVSFKAAESTSESFGVAAAIGMEASNTTRTGGAGAAEPAAQGPAPAGAGSAGTAGAAPAAATEKERAGSLGFELGSESSSEKKGATFKAGSIDITSGRNASFEGTKVAADGDVNVAAKGDVTVTTAKSTSSSVGVSLSGERESASNAAEPDARTSSTRASAGVEAGSSSTNEGASFESGGKLSIASGGRTTLVSTEVKAEGGEQVKAGGGVVRSTATDTESGVRMTAVGRSDTKPKAPAAAPAAGDPGTAATAAAAPAPAAAAAPGTAAKAAPAAKKADDKAAQASAARGAKAGTT